jgi:hypothetical protein
LASTSPWWIEYRCLFSFLERVRMRNHKFTVIKSEWMGLEMWLKWKGACLAKVKP